MKRSKLLLVINNAGMLFLIGGVLGMPLLGMYRHWWQIALCGSVGALGWFMLVIKVPYKYPKKLFTFDLTDLLVTVGCCGSGLAIGMSRQVISNGGIMAAIFIGLAIVYMAASVLGRVASRIGARLSHQKA